MPAERPHYHGHRKRLKERYQAQGLSGFQDYEALELFLTYAIPRGDVKLLAKTLIAHFGSLKAVFDAEIAELETVKGVKRHTAILLKLSKELAGAYLKEQARERSQISCTQELYDYCLMVMGGLKDEQFRVIYLDAQNRIIDSELIEEGIVNQAVVYPRKVIERALKKKASALILAHNHPSGHVRPSDADVRLTKSVQDTARLLDILVHDHIIIGENRFFSFREEGIM
ncbi:MAG TPA: DNA repair protein RadC [Syntrophales bacterium]|nr:DNA repair protein RadC [Syntrophales bacterium]